MRAWAGACFAAALAVQWLFHPRAPIGRPRTGPVAPAERAALRAAAVEVDASSPVDRARVAEIVAALRSDAATAACGHAADVGVAARVLVASDRAHGEIVAVNPRIAARSEAGYDTTAARDGGPRRAVRMHAEVTLAFMDGALALGERTLVLTGWSANCAQLELDS